MRGDGNLLAQGFGVTMMIALAEVFWPEFALGGLPYLIAVLLCLRARNPACAYLMAGFVTIFLTLGIMLAPDGVETGRGMAERLLAVALVWITAHLIGRKLHEIEAVIVARNQELLKNAFKIARVGGWEWNLITDVKHWSSDLLHIYEFEPDVQNVTVGDILRRVHPEEREAVSDLVIRSIERGEDVEFEHRVVLPSGKTKHLRVFGQLSFDEAGNAVRLSGATQDITEQKKAQQQLDNQRQQLHLITNNLPILIAYLDEDQRFRFVNKTFLDWHVRQKEDVIGQTFRHIIGDDYYKLAEPEIIKALKGEATSAEVTASFRDGNTRTIERSFIPHLDAEGNVVGVFAMGRDVTERNIAQIQLRQAQKMDAISQLTGGVAHEFNNLMMVIFGNIEILDELLPEADPLRRYTGKAMKGVERGALLTQSLLAFSRRQRLDVRNVQVNELVSSMHEILKRTLGATIAIEMDLERDLWPTKTDAGQLEGALLNFVLNARDAMPEGGRITIRTRNNNMIPEAVRQKGGGVAADFVTLEVVDTGVGMSAEQIEHAFEPFYSTKDVNVGAGLGLSVVFGFAKQSDGFVEIDSQLGKGTVARLGLPRATGIGQADEAEAMVNVTPKGCGKILVVEDDVEVCALVGGRLESLGYEVIEVADGHSALTVLSADPQIDLLFTDIVLPGGMSGVDIAKHARRDYPHLKILLTSGFPKVDLGDLELEREEISLLPKPYKKVELAAAILATLHPRKPETDQADKEQAPPPTF